MTTRSFGMSGQDWTILLALSVLWGGSFLFIEIAIAAIPPLTFVLIRVALAAAALWLFLLVRGQKLPVPPGAILAFVVLALLNNVLPFISLPGRSSRSRRGSVRSSMRRPRSGA
jgi:drug/metabolite transporter (DMT)-like permease